MEITKEPHRIRILVSACLMGVHCRYDGGSNFNAAIRDFLCGSICTPDSPHREELLHEILRAEWIPVCPEQLGGLPTPRCPAERQGDGVVTRDGRDVTEQFRRGAAETLRLAEMYGVTAAVFKARSPSCGCGEIYDGTFTKTLRDGDGVTAELLKKNGIPVYTEGDFFPGAFLKKNEKNSSIFPKNDVQ